MSWQVPITIATATNNEAYKFVLDKQSATITVEDVMATDWIKVCPSKLLLLIIINNN